MSVKIEECDQKSLEEIPFWAVTEEDPEETFLSATSIDEAIKEWKENVEDDPEAVFDSVEQWEKHKADPEARITVTAFRKIEHPVMKAKDILDDIITNMEENDRCFQDNTYRSNKTLLEAAQKFKETVEKEVDPYYYGAFDVLCWLNKPNKGI